MLGSGRTASCPPSRAFRAAGAEIKRETIVSIREMFDLNQETRRVIALGFFDGVHLGHGALLRRVAEVVKGGTRRGGGVHLRQAPGLEILGRQIPLLSTPADREGLMERCYGIQEVQIGRFDRMMRMPWRDFVTEYLRKELGVVHVVAYHDFHFGYRGEGQSGPAPAAVRRAGHRMRHHSQGGAGRHHRVLHLYPHPWSHRGDGPGHGISGPPHVFTGEVVHGKSWGAPSASPRPI